MQYLKFAPMLLLVSFAASSAVTDTPAAQSAPSTDVAAADNAFGLRLLKAVQKTRQHSNVVLSPVSAALDLAMLLDGAEGETKREILAALSLGGLTSSAINDGNAHLIKALRTPPPNITLSVADSVWVDHRHATLRPDYLKRTRTSYDAEVTELDFSSPDAALRINEWVSKQTDGKIPKIIEKFSQDDRLLLLNALYFKGLWTHNFKKSQTVQSKFALSDGTFKQVPRMFQQARFDYFETPQLQAVRLPFGDGDLAMQVFLPTQASTLDALLAALTLQQWQSWQTSFTAHPGTLGLPRFELKSNYDLNEPLQALGMQRAFRRDAQFAGMLSSPDRSHPETVFVSSVKQSTYWKVDEEGSEAAAVTSNKMQMMALSVPKNSFSMLIDRPFFCAIEDRRTGAVLFLGAIYDPTT